MGVGVGVHVVPAFRRLWYEYHMFKTSPNKTTKSCLNKQNNSRKKNSLFNSRTLQIQKQHKKTRLKCQFTEYLLCVKHVTYDFLSHLQRTLKGD